MEGVAQKEFGSASSIHQYFLEWKRLRVFTRLWRNGLAEYDKMEGIVCLWQGIDGVMVKAPLALEAVRANPKDRGKNGTKRSLLVDGKGTPLSLVVTGGRRHNVALLEPNLDHLVNRSGRPSEKVGCGSIYVEIKGMRGNPLRNRSEESITSRMCENGAGKWKPREGILVIVLADGWSTECIRG